MNIRWYHDRYYLNYSLGYSNDNRYRYPKGNGNVKGKGNGNGNNNGNGNSGIRNCIQGLHSMKDQLSLASCITYCVIVRQLIILSVSYNLYEHVP